MSAGPASRRSFGHGVAAAVVCTALGGCLAYEVVSAPVKLAATTVVVAGETAGAVVSTTGKIATSAVRATGSVGSGGIDAAAKLAQAGMVTFVEVATGNVVRVPWQEGFTLARAGDAAKIRVVQRAVEVVRGGKLVYSATRAMGEGATLATGDVVRVGK